MKFDFDQAIRYLRIALILFFCSWGLIWFSIRADRTAKMDRNVVERAVSSARDVPGIVKRWITATSAGLEHQEIVLDPELDLAPLGKLQNCPGLNDHLYLLHYRFEGGHDENGQRGKTGGWKAAGLPWRQP